MRKLILLIPVLLTLLFPSVSALDAIPEWETTCFNSTHLRKFTNTTDPNTGLVIYAALDILKCPYDCNSQRDICNKWPGDAIPGEHYILFQIIAFGVLFVSVFRLDISTKEMRIGDIFVPILSLILFSVLALQGNNVIDMATGEAVPVNLAVSFDMGMAVFSLIPFFFNVFKYARAVAESGGAE